MKVLYCLLSYVTFSSIVISSYSNKIQFFFSVNQLDNQTDQYGNRFSLLTENAITSQILGANSIDSTSFTNDNMWSVYEYDNYHLLVSHAPGQNENSPEIIFEITPALPGLYEVVLNYYDSIDAPGTGAIQAALGDNELQVFSDNSLNAFVPSEGVIPKFPQFNGAAVSSMVRKTASLGTVDVEKGNSIRIRIDDVPGSEFNNTAAPQVTSTFHGITLRMLIPGGTRILPTVTKWTRGVNGLRYKTSPVDENLSDDQWLAKGDNNGTDNMWNTNAGFGPYGDLIESYPAKGEDAPKLVTSIIFEEPGNYDIIANIGDTGEASAAHNAIVQDMLSFSFSQNSLLGAYPHSFPLNNNYGYNNYEYHFTAYNIFPNERKDFYIDDIPQSSNPNINRSIYMGMRVSRRPEGVIAFQIKPFNHTHAYDVYGNVYDMRPYAIRSRLSERSEWLTFDNRNVASDKWDVRENLGPYGPVIESIPSTGNDAPLIELSVTFEYEGIYNVFVNLGDNGSTDPVENTENPSALLFGFEPDRLQKLSPNEGEFVETPGYNNYEIRVGQVSAEQFEQKYFYIDDVQDGSADRSVWLGMRFERANDVAPSKVDDWSVF